MCIVSIRGHKANFYEAEARCHEAEIEAEARKSEAEAECRGRMIWPQGHMGLEALTSLASTAFVAECPALNNARNFSCTVWEVDR